MALPEPTGREIQTVEKAALRADVYRTAVTLLNGVPFTMETEPEDVLRLARYLLGEEN